MLHKINSWIVVFTILTALLVFGGCASDSVLLSDSEYGVKFVTTSECPGYYEVRKNEIKNFDNALAEYAVYLPGSDQWGDDFWYYYSVYSQAEYNDFNDDMPPGVPKIILTLDSGNLLTKWDPQDGPTDVPENCFVEAEKL